MKSKIKIVFLLLIAFLLSACSGTVQSSSSGNSKASPGIEFGIDAPENGSTVTGSIQINGKIYYDEWLKSVEILYSDEFVLDRAHIGLESPQIYGKMETEFGYMLDTARFSNGEQVIKVKVTDNKGESKISEVKINVNNPPLLTQYIVEDGDTGDPRIKETTDKAKEIVNTVIKPGMSDTEKVLVLHDYIITHAMYDDLNARWNSITQEDHSAHGILIQGTGTCTGYANAMALLLDTAGIENKRIYGLTKTANLISGDWRGHTWNLVKMDGKFYHVDVTWDDPDSKPDDKVDHIYFKLTDKQLYDSDHLWDRRLYPESN